MPTETEVQAFKDAFKQKYHTLEEVYSVADGLKLLLEQSQDFVVQNMFYNGWTHDHYVSNVLVFAPNGTVIACAINAPGSMHDSVVSEWGNIYTKLGLEHEKHGGKCVVDSAFCRNSYPFLIKSSQDETRAKDAREVLQIRQATSARQASEWGMRSFQGMFPRLKDRFMYEENGERRVMLLCSIHLFNLRTRMVGINQILSTYMPHLSVEANDFLQSSLNI